MKKILIFFAVTNLYSQTLDLNNSHLYDYIKTLDLTEKISVNSSYTIKPLSTEIIDSLNLIFDYKKSIYKKNKFEFSVFPITYIMDYNTNYPYNRNNGSLIPNRGYQQLIQFGINLKLGLLNIQIKPEHHFSENKEFNGFWDGHYPEIWSKRYVLWNAIDMPERFGSNQFNRFLIGQSSIRLNWKKISLGISNENLWWGPSKRNSIMMSNHAQSFPHVSFNSVKPVKTILGNIEWQLISGKLESSGFYPPNIDYEYAGRKLYVPKTNHLGGLDDWRYLQGMIISFSPKLIDGLTLGYIRWAQFYSKIFGGEYLQGKGSYFPVFGNLFRKNDLNFDVEAQTNQAAGGFFKWVWQDSKAEIYFEYYLNDSKQNFRDFLLDTDNSRAATIGLNKVFELNSKQILFSWEWTQMEQSASKLIRGADSWYAHGNVRDGYTNMGEVLGSAIGPGSNSHFISIKKFNKINSYGVGIEIVDNDNDFIHYAFASARDFRRYWKDFNLNLNFSKFNPKFLLDVNLVYVRSLNYQWELDDYVQPYYHPGKDRNNIHINFNLNYFFD